MALPITCILPVYIGVDADEFTRAYRSIAHQTAQPDEILVVLDGPVQDGVESFLDAIAGPQLTVVRFEENRGVCEPFSFGNLVGYRVQRRYMPCAHMRMLNRQGIGVGIAA